MKYRVVFEVDYVKSNFDFETIAEAGKFADSLNENYSGEKVMKIRIEFVSETKDGE